MAVRMTGTGVCVRPPDPTGVVRGGGCGPDEREGQKGQTGEDPAVEPRVRENQGVLPAMPQGVGAGRLRRGALLLLLHDAGAVHHYTIVPTI